MTIMNTRLRLKKIHDLVKHSNRYKSGYLPAKLIRQQFVDYFQNQSHSFIKSSSVKPQLDPSLEFVNAGMNQFKNVFLGLASPPALRAVNSQKCIRIGGKHNDLNVVGHDSYHHTFFEMLGNWSFGDYFKKDACELAWVLITSPPYSLPKDRLYVTYFGGDDRLGLSPDVETKEIWRQLGVPDSRILPFGLKDNFWEMGLSGPCGPCTEIHFDHLGAKPRPELVNAGVPDLTELWNLVFIQYNRSEDGALSQLKNSFVDTGMGLERLVSILQGKMSNYDSDLFSPLFSTISKISGVEEYKGRFGESSGIDANYRILADHIRMATVAISDNVFPDQSHGLRRVVRKCLEASDIFTKGRGVELACELTNVVADSLGGTYPEINTNLQQVKHVLRYESDVWEQMKSDVKKDWEAVLQKNPLLCALSDVRSPGLINAIKELDGVQDVEIPPNTAVVLYDRHGLHPHIIEELAKLKGCTVSMERLSQDISQLKVQNKSSLFSSGPEILSKIVTKFPGTDDRPKYSCSRVGTDYLIPEHKTSVLCTISSGEALRTGQVVENGSKVTLLLSSTNFWSSVKGDSDTGVITLFSCGEPVGEVKVEEVTRLGQYVLHSGTLRTFKNDLKAELWTASIAIDLNRRLALMKNCTVFHILNHVLRQQYVTNVQSLTNTEKCIQIKYTLYGENISEGKILLMEHHVNEMIKKKCEIDVSQVDRQELTWANIDVPPIVSTQSLHFPVVQIKEANSKKELSCGPTLFNTSDVDEFCIVELDAKPKRDCTLTCLSGPNVKAAYSATNALLESLYELSKAPYSVINEELDKAKALVDDHMVPLSMRVELNHLVLKLKNVAKELKLEQQITVMENLVSEAKANGKKFIVYCAEEDTKLQKLTRLCPDIPVLILGQNRGNLTARCCSPQGNRLKADEWMRSVAEEVGSEVVKLQGHDPSLVCGLKPIKLSKTNSSFVVINLMNVAKSAATDHVKSRSQAFQP